MLFRCEECGEEFFDDCQGDSVQCMRCKSHKLMYIFEESNPHEAYAEF